MDATVIVVCRRCACWSVRLIGWLFGSRDGGGRASRRSKLCGCSSTRWSKERDANREAATSSPRSKAAQDERDAGSKRGSRN